LARTLDPLQIDFQILELLQNGLELLVLSQLSFLSALVIRRVLQIHDLRVDDGLVFAFEQPLFLENAFNGLLVLFEIEVDNLHVSFEPLSSAEELHLPLAQFRLHLLNHDL